MQISVVENDIEIVKVNRLRGPTVGYFVVYLGEQLMRTVSSFSWSLYLIIYQSETQPEKNSKALQYTLYDTFVA